MNQKNPQNVEECFRWALHGAGRTHPDMVDNFLDGGMLGRRDCAQNLVGLTIAADDKSHSLQDPGFHDQYQTPPFITQALAADLRFDKNQNPAPFKTGGHPGQLEERGTEATQVPRIDQHLEHGPAKDAVCPESGKIIQKDIKLQGAHGGKLRFLNQSCN